MPLGWGGFWEAPGAAATGRGASVTLPDVHRGPQTRAVPSFIPSIACFAQERGRGELPKSDPSGQRSGHAGAVSRVVRLALEACRAAVLRFFVCAVSWVATWFVLFGLPVPAFPHQPANRHMSSIPVRTSSEMVACGGRQSCAITRPEPEGRFGSVGALEERR